MSVLGDNSEVTPVSCLKKRKIIEPRSWVWLHSYATKVNQTSATCNLCIPSTTLQMYNGSTTEISKHLLNKHGITEKSLGHSQLAKRFCFDFENGEEEEESIVTHNSLSEKHYTAPASKVEKINEKLINFIIKKNLSFNIVDSVEFQELLDSVKSGYYKLPCRQTIRYNLLPEIVNFYSFIKNLILIIIIFFKSILRQKIFYLLK